MPRSSTAAPIGVECGDARRAGRLPRVLDLAESVARSRAFPRWRPPARGGRHPNVLLDNLLRSANALRTVDGVHSHAYPGIAQPASGAEYSARDSLLLLAGP